MKEKLRSGHKVVNRATGTSWSSRYNVCFAFINCCKEFMEILNNVENNPEKTLNRRKAGLKNNLKKFELVFMAVFWTSLLERFNKTSNILQSTSANLEDVCTNF
ncbi:Hypothetical protein CINCED_3A020105 [Cinara cedri]|uniref:Uncharacterized protein n=1 Tax=Cinara cedri TaxID=506608 RepID=A0A5E4N028_9HEMI|nr:Hypothetical protein CINCED_3A020105 [Cinara cedri]